MKGNWRLEIEPDDEVKVLPDDIDTEIGYNGHLQMWRCNNHNPVNTFMRVIPKESHTIDFCSNCSWRKNCPDGEVDIVSQNWNSIQWWFDY